MNQSEARRIDTTHKILPGGSGEHEFYISDNYEKVSADLLNFTHHCGGYLQEIDRNTLSLSVSYGSTYRIQFQDASRVVKIDIKVGDEYIPYWSERHQRNTPDGHYQQGNIRLPLLTS
jgi:hypothetical protein